MPPKRKTSLVPGPEAKKVCPPEGSTDFYKDEIVLCEHDGFFYEAKIHQVDSVKGYFIHYQGWNKRHDTWVAFDDVDTRFKKCDVESAKVAKESLKQARQSIVKTPQPKPTPKSGNRSRRESSTATSEADLKTKELAKQKTTPKIEKTKAEGDQKQSRPSKLKRDDYNGFASSKRRGRDASVEPDIFSDLLHPDLADILMEDNEMITHRHKLPKVPADASIHQILKDYCEARDVPLQLVEKQMNLKDTKNMVSPTSLSRSDCCTGLLNLFDACISQVLIYPFERENLEAVASDAEAKEEGKPPAEEEVLRLSHFVGVTYLLRMLSRLSDILAVAGITKDRSELILDTCSDLASFLNERMDKYYDLNSYYQQPSSDYLRRNTGV